METQHKQQVVEFLELVKERKHFKKLETESNKDNSFSVKLKVSGYNELNLMVSDLLKAGIILLNERFPKSVKYCNSFGYYVMT